jgi:hypothetical protein
MAGLMSEDVSLTDRIEAIVDLAMEYGVKRLSDPSCMDELSDILDGIIEDLDKLELSSEEYGALVEHHEKEIWVWTKMAQHSDRHGDKKDRKRHGEIVMWERERLRQCKELQASASAREDLAHEERKAARGGR